MSDLWLEAWLKDNWEELYTLKEAELTVGMGKVKFKVEDWESVCIEYQAEQMGYELSDDEDEWWDVMWEAVEKIVRDEGWDGYVYIDSDESGVPFGVTIFYRVEPKTL